MKNTITETTRLLLQGNLTKEEADKILLALHNVSNQRKLLIAFAEHMDTDDPNEFQGTPYNEIVDNFLKSNL